jgi:UDP-3-O-acyl-N-acetylglucosamine deacetylase
MPIIGHYRGHRAGHLLNFRLMEALVGDSSAYEEIEASGKPVTAVPA